MPEVEVKAEAPEVAMPAVEVKAEAPEIVVPAPELEVAARVPEVALPVSEAEAVAEAPEAIVPAAEAEIVADELEVIKGIGPKYASKLRAAGITSFAALAALTPERLAEIIQPASWQRPDFSGWIAEAAALAAKVKDK